MTLTDFLLARIAEDEDQARRCLTKEALTPYSDERIPPVKPEEWGALADNYLGGEMGQFCQRFTPLRVLADCEVKRDMIRYHEMLCEQGQQSLVFESHAVGMRITFRHMARVYKDHPDFKPDWLAA